MRNIFLPLFLLIVALTVNACSPLTSTPAPVYSDGSVVSALGETATTPASLSLDVLRDSTYHSPDWGEFQLSDGIYYRTPPTSQESPESYTTHLLDLVLYGDLDLDGSEDAIVFLNTQNGGSGHFIEMAAVINQDGSAHNISTISLGDRVVIESGKVEGGSIVLNMRIHASTDGMCCPSQTETWIFTLENSQLIQLNRSGALEIVLTDAPSTPTPLNTPSGNTSHICEANWFFTFDQKHASLGQYCPEPVKFMDAVGQDFEGGRVYCYAPDPAYPIDQRGTVYIIYDDGEWVTFPDDWDTTQPSIDSSLVVPEERYQPVEGIGKVWRLNEEVRDRLGWAYEPQSKFQGRIQYYSTQADTLNGDTHYSFIDHGKWGLVLLLNSVDIGPNKWETAGTYP